MSKQKKHNQNKESVFNMRTVVGILGVMYCHNHLSQFLHMNPWGGLALLEGMLWLGLGVYLRRFRYQDLSVLFLFMSAVFFISFCYKSYSEVLGTKLCLGFFVGSLGMLGLGAALASLPYLIFGLWGTLSYFYFSLQYALASPTTGLSSLTSFSFMIFCACFIYIFKSFYPHIQTYLQSFIPSIYLKPSLDK